MADSQYDCGSDEKNIPVARGLPQDPSARPSQEARPIVARPISTLAYASTSLSLPLVSGPPGPPVLSVGSTFLLLIFVGIAYFGTGMVAYSAVDHKSDASALELSIAVGQWLVFLALPLAVALAAGADLRMTFSWYPPRTDLWILTLGITLPVVGVVNYVGDFSMMLLAEPYDRLFHGYLPDTAERLAKTSKLFEADTPLGLVTVLLLAAVTPAVCEEHFFRGLIQSSLLKRIPSGVIVITVAVIFAAFHAEPVTFPALLLIGLVVGLVTARTSCLLYAFWIHLVNNGLSVILQNLFLKNVGELSDEVGSFNSLPFYLVGLTVGLLAFIARTPRLQSRQRFGQSVSVKPPVFVPGRWHRAGVWMAGRWRTAALVAILCSVGGLALDIVDLYAIRVSATTRPAESDDDTDRGDDIERNPRDRSMPWERYRDTDSPSTLNVRADEDVPLWHGDGGCGERLAPCVGTRCPRRVTGARLCAPIRKTDAPHAAP